MLIDFDHNQILTSKDGTDIVSLTSKAGRIWENNVKYIHGDIVTYHGKSYVAKSTHISTGGNQTDSAPDEAASTVWEPVTIDERGGVKFKAGVHYEPGDLITRGEDLYKCNTATNSAFNQTEWDIIPLPTGRNYILNPTFEIWNDLDNTGTRNKNTYGADVYCIHPIDIVSGQLTITKENMFDKTYLKLNTDVPVVKGPAADCGIWLIMGDDDVLLIGVESATFSMKVVANFAGIFTISFEYYGITHSGEKVDLFYTAEIDYKIANVEQYVEITLPKIPTSLVSDTDLVLVENILIQMFSISGNYYDFATPNTWFDTGASNLNPKKKKQYTTANSTDWMNKADNWVAMAEPKLRPPMEIRSCFFLTVS